LPRANEIEPSPLAKIDRPEKIAPPDSHDVNPFPVACPNLSLRRTPLQTLVEMSQRQDYASNPAKLWVK